MKLTDLRPGMENVDLIANIARLDEPREVTASYGVTHVIVDGEIEDDTGKMDLTVWNEQIDKLKDVDVGDNVKLTSCFITSFRGVLSVNVGRDSDVLILDVDNGTSHA